MTKSKSVYDFPGVGCYVDESAGSVDDCNRRAIELASEYGFEANFCGFYDGLRGLTLGMTLDQAESISHPGECFEDCVELAKYPEIAKQLESINPEVLRAAMKDCGAWSVEELADHEANKIRALWLAACDISENAGEQLSEAGDEAVDFLNELETRSFMFWQFEDNSLFLVADVDSAREDVGFVSSKDQDYPADDYEGEWLHVSDHGNTTLYVRENGQDREIWSVV